jgi:hypothetical protein
VVQITLNIFFLDEDLILCAQYHCDAHVVKMILESTQMLCTVLSLSGINTPYRPTHPKHPCVVWSTASLDNWCWLRDLVVELNQEYQFRFEHTHVHRSADVALKLPTPPIPSRGITERPQTMPEHYKIPGNPVAAYRKFYLGEKKHLFKYTKRAVPPWITRT